MTLPNSITKIGGNAFKHCTGLTSMTIPMGVKYIWNNVFEGCTGLTSVTLPNSITMIDYGTFKDCTGLTSVTIPSSVTNIGIRAFEGCTGLTSVSIPRSVTKIEQSAFQNCASLASLTIPMGVSYIGDYAFAGCDNVEAVYYEQPDFINASNNVFSCYDNATLYVRLLWLFDTYKKYEPWKNFRRIDLYTPAGLEDVATDIDPEAPMEVFDIRGLEMGSSIDNLPAGVYIVRQNGKAKKIAVQ